MGVPHDNDVARRAAMSPVLTSEEFRPMSAIVHVDIAAHTERGRCRQVNEDHYLIVRLSRQQTTLDTSLSPSDLPVDFEEASYAMLVADGLGGTGSGAVASRIALSTVAHMAVHFGKWNIRVDADAMPDIIKRLEWYSRQADQAVYLRGRSDAQLEGMATTLTLAYSAGDDLFVAHVGHSRAYLFRDGRLRRLTRDHTLERQLADSQGPMPVDRPFRDLQHALTDAIGHRVDGPLVDVDHIQLHDGDRVVLCTNGLTDVVSDERMAELLAVRRRAEDQSCELVELARELGAEDNATVVVAEYRIPASPLRRPSL
jgi:serine/threonine protein phosphatase PrpC